MEGLFRLLGEVEPKALVLGVDMARVLDWMKILIERIAMKEIGGKYYSWC